MSNVHLIALSKTNTTFTNTVFARNSSQHSPLLAIDGATRCDFLHITIESGEHSQLFLITSKTIVTFVNSIFEDSIGIVLVAVPRGQ
jgi:hypothetical protein